MEYKLKHNAGEFDSQNQPVPVEARQIEKRGQIVNFTFNEVVSDIKLIDKKIVECRGMMEVNAAKMENIARNHPFVLEMSEFDRKAIFLYTEAKGMYDAAKKHEENFLEGRTEAIEELKECAEQIPELKPFLAEVEQVPAAEVDAAAEVEDKADVGETATNTEENTEASA